MKNKKLILTAIAIVAAIAVMAGVFLATRPETAAGAKHITVTVVHADSSEKVFEYDTDEEYLGSVLLNEGLVEGEEGPYGLVISAVDGEEAIWEVSQSYWAILVGPNDEFATTGADGIVLNDGDVFKLVYTIG